PPHVVLCGVVVVDLLAPIGQPNAADQVPSQPRPVGLRVTDLRVDDAVQQVRLPPVVPAEEEPVRRCRRPADDAEPGAGDRPDPSGMTTQYRTFGRGS